MSSSASGQSVVRGSQAPRVFAAPSTSATSGDEAIALAHSAGLHLDEWQQHVLRVGLGEADDGQWAARDVCLIVPRQNGKGSVLEALELAALFLFGERLILHTAHEMKTAKNHYERMQSLIRAVPSLDAQVAQWRNSNEEISIELKVPPGSPPGTKGAKLRFIARSTGSGRGFSADRLILDEAMILTQESLAALLFTLTTAPNPQTWYAGSAGFETSALLARKREQGLRGDSRGLAYMEWSAPDDADLDDEDAWAQANPALGTRVTLAGIVSERNAVGEVQFARERMGIWAPVAGEAVIELAVWDPLADETSTPAEPAVLALDINPDRSIASVAIASAAQVVDRATGEVKPGTHVSVLENRAGVTWVVDRIANLHAEGRVSGVVIDSGSPAAALIPALRARGVKIVEISAREYAEACGGFYDAVQAGTVVHRGQPNLRGAVDAGRKRTLSDAWAWHRRTAKSDITPLVAVTLAHFAAAKPGKVDRRVLVFSR